MTRRAMKFLAAALLGCMLTTPLSGALSEPVIAEDEVVSEWTEAAGDETELELVAETPAPTPEPSATPMPKQQGPRAYARVAGSEALVFSDAHLSDIRLTLGAGDAVLVTKAAGDIAAVAFVWGGETVEGFMAAEALTWLTTGEADTLQDALAEGEVTLYQGDVNWPLPIVSVDAIAKASDFTAISNDREFTINGVTFTARMVGDHSDCWSWARALYNMIWGTKFTSDFEGTVETGMNLIADLTDDQRQLTGANLKKYVGMAALGCTLRICSCPRDCSNIDKDGCSKHEKHSLMVVAKDSAGMVVMDNMTGNGSDKFATRYYTWDKFASHWAKYKMIKYIKWPGAQVYGRPTPTPEPTAVPDPVAVTLNESGSVAAGVGVDVQLRAALTPEEAVSGLTWSSSDEATAIVSETGVVTPLKPGSATVTVRTDNGLTDSVVISIVTPSKVTLSHTGTVTLGVGGTLALTASVAPEGAYQGVEWVSSNPGAAIVENGIVTAMSAGTATITATTVSGGKSAKVKVKVTDSNAVTKVKLNRSGTVTMTAGGTLDVAVSLTPASARTALYWASSDPTVAIVEEGVVTALSAGKATVGVVTANGKKASFKVKVTDASAVTKIKLSKSGTAKLKAGDTLAVTAALTPVGSSARIAWTSSNTAVALVEDGLVVAVGKGKATITATAGGKKASFKVKVSGEASNAVTKLALNPSGTVKLEKGETLSLKVTVSPSGADTPLAWASSDTDVATVRDGLVTAVGAGEVTVGVAAANGVKASVKIQVSGSASNVDEDAAETATRAAAIPAAAEDDDAEVEAAKLNKSGTVSLKKGSSLQLAAAFSPSGASTPYIWKSTDTDVAVVSASGLVTAVGKGTATVGVLCENGVYATVKIKVG